MNLQRASKHCAALVRVLLPKGKKMDNKRIDVYCGVKQADNFLIGQMNQDLQQNLNGRVYRITLEFNGHDSNVKDGMYVLRTTSQEIFLKLGLFSHTTHALFIKWLENFVFKAGQIEANISFMETDLDDQENVVDKHIRHNHVIRTVTKSAIHYHFSPAK